ncbi:hypothetical protein ACFYN3_41185 [Streptomyces lavendulae]|uniref:hypothetical protein n=1 Tax=Streptomyces lavendulae TaxID=1914 RepID=UPI0033E6DED5
MAVPHSDATKGELDDAVVLAVLNPLTADSVPGSGAASQLGLDPRLVPAAREVPGLQEFDLGIPALDLVVQERLEQSGRTESTASLRGMRSSGRLWPESAPH